MFFIYSLILITILSLALSDSIRKNSKLYYGIVSVISILISVYELIIKLNTTFKLKGFISLVEITFIHGNVAVSFFILVMFAGALNKKWKVTRKLMSIRAQLAIMGSILIFSHVLVYIVRFFIIKLPSAINGKPLTKLYIAYMLVGFITFLILIPLFLTSIKKIRSKLTGLKWKKLHRWSYLFYLLVYVHIVLVLFNSKEVDFVGLISYTVVFGIYSLLKLTKKK